MAKPRQLTLSTMPRAQKLYAVLNCFVASLFCVYEFVLRVLPSSMTHELSQAFHTNTTGIGFLSAAFFVAYAGMQIPVGILFDKYSARGILTIAVGICAAGSLLLAHSHGLALAMISRVLMGASAAFAVSGIFLLVSRWFPIEYFPLITGLVQLMCSLGAVLGQSPIAALLHTYSWRLISIDLAVIGLVMAVIYFAVVRSYPKGLEPSAAKRQALSVLKCVKEVASKPKNWLIASYAGFTWGPISALAALWGISFLKAVYHIGGPQASNEIAACWVGVAIGSPILGWLAKKMKNECLLLIYSPLVSLLVVLTILYVPGLPQAAMVILLFLFGFMAGTLPISFHRAKVSNPSYISGTTIAFINMAVVMGGSVFQPLIGWLLTFESAANVKLEHVHQVQDYQWALLILPVSAVVCTVLGILINHVRDKKGVTYERA